MAIKGFVVSDQCYSLQPVKSQQRADGNYFDAGICTPSLPPTLLG